MRLVLFKTKTVSSVKKSALYLLASIVVKVVLPLSLVPTNKIVFPFNLTAPACNPVKRCLKGGLTNGGIGGFKSSHSLIVPLFN